ncbi:hypothetical protein Glove_646g5 [Diversispora epigaea]|uniref:HCP-like protein n=1 Tax=Diversispora epigaea TaxID=1348612 RepID=A0A397GA72_9GLOM|nr:hypothetical protein Glove_646g5 [Diversispora epigaea]
MALKFFNLASNKMIDTSSKSLSLKKLYNINKEISTISLAYMYFHGIVEKDTKKAFQIYSKAADEGSHRALNCMACYRFGFEKRNIVALSNVGYCYEKGIGIAIDEKKGISMSYESVRAGNIYAMYNVGYSYRNGIGVDKDEKEAFKCSFSQYGHGIDIDQVKAFEWYKKAAENDSADGQYVLGLCFYEGFGTKLNIKNQHYIKNRERCSGEPNKISFEEGHIITNIDFVSEDLSKKILSIIFGIKLSIPKWTSSEVVAFLAHKLIKLANGRINNNNNRIISSTLVNGARVTLNSLTTLNQRTSKNGLERRSMTSRYFLKVAN